MMKWKIKSLEFDVHGNDLLNGNICIWLSLKCENSHFSRRSIQINVCKHYTNCVYDVKCSSFVPHIWPGLIRFLDAYETNSPTPNVHGKTAL